jgi:hypothetical protein
MHREEERERIIAKARKDENAKKKEGRQTELEPRHVVDFSLSFFAFSPFRAFAMILLSLLLCASILCAMPSFVPLCAPS